MEHRLKAALVLAAIGALASCGETIQPTYQITIITPLGVNPFATATRATMTVGTGAETPATFNSDHTSLDLLASGIDVATQPVGSITIRAYDANNALVAVGSSPPLDLLLQSTSLRIFVQAPRSFGTLPDGLATPGTSGTAPNPIADPYAAVVPVQGNAGLMASNAPLLILGRSAGPALTAASGASVDAGAGDMNVDGGTDGDAGAATLATPISTALVFNPFAMFGDQLLFTTPQPARYGGGAIVAANGNLVAFGGFEGTSVVSTVSQMGLIRHVPGFLVDLAEPTAPVITTNDGSLARARSPLVAAGPLVYALGGLTIDHVATDAVLVIDPSKTDATALAVATLPVPAPGAQPATTRPVLMAAARVGHTATVLVSSAATQPIDTYQIFVVGGATAGQPLAEAFTFDVESGALLAQASVTVATSANLPVGARRARHTTVALPDNPGPRGALVIGGVDESGKATRSILIYDAPTGVLKDAGVSLATARADATAFIVGNDIVVTGGVDENGAPAATAEVFDLATRTPVTTTPIPALGFVGAQAFVLPNHTVLVAGGDDANGGAFGPSSDAEIYTPRP